MSYKVNIAVACNLCTFEMVVYVDVEILNHVRRFAVNRCCRILWIDSFQWVQTLPHQRGLSFIAIEMLGMEYIDGVIVFYEVSVFWEKTVQPSCVR